MRLQAHCLAGLACVAARNEEAKAAGRLWTLAEGLEHDVGFRMGNDERVRYEQNLTQQFRATHAYRAGIADTVGLGGRTSAAEILRS